MKRFFISVAVLPLLLVNFAHAKTPPEVMKSYRAYDAAMKQNDFKSAIRHAKKAWQYAEDLMGEHALTGDLAYNYGYVEKNQGNKEKSIKALERSIELASLKKEDATALQIEREVELISSMDGISKDATLEKRIKAAKKFASSNGLRDSVFVGELYVHEANVCNRKLQRKMAIPAEQIGSLINKSSTEKGIKIANEKCASFAKRAVNIFDKTPEDVRPAYVASAYNYVGYGYETNRSWLEAALSYQKARNAIEDIYGRDHPLVARTIGRWLNARNFLKRKDRLEYAESQGLCKCWPFVTDRATVRMTDWVKPNFPAKALRRSSGYAIVQMDVSDEGVPQNVEILNSWPDDIYDKSSLDAAKQLKFPPKANNEPAGFREKITIPYSYFLRSGLEPI